MSRALPPLAMSPEVNWLAPGESGGRYVFELRGQLSCPRISFGVSQLICTSAEQVQSILRKCSLK
jgi:hypothetical protein